MEFLNDHFQPRASDESGSPLDIQIPKYNYVNGFRLRFCDASPCADMKTLYEQTRVLFGVDCGKTLLMQSISLNSEEMLEFVLQMPEINLNCTTLDKHEAVRSSIRLQRSSSFIIRLIQACFDPSDSDALTDSLLHEALLLPTLDVAQELLKRGANIDARDRENNTPLHCAIERDDLEAVCMLLYYGADVTISSCGETPFASALTFDTYDIASALINFYDKDDIILPLMANVSRLTPHRLVNLYDLVKSGADVNRVDCKGNNALVYSLRDVTAELFQLILERIDHRMLLTCKPPFLFSYIYAAEFSSSEWVECLYLLLKLPIASELVMPINTECFCDSYLFLEFLEAFYNRQLEFAERMRLIYTILSFGVKVCSDGIEFAYRRYGFNEELQAIIYCGNVDSYNDFYNPLFDFLFALKRDPSTTIIFHFLEEEILSQNNLQQPAILSEHVSSLGFFAMPSSTKHKFLNANLKDSEFLKKLKTLPEVPTLVELARNSARNFIKQSCEFKHVYQFYDMAKMLNLPVSIRDLICLKTPLY